MADVVEVLLEPAAVVVIELDSPATAVEVVTAGAQGPAGVPGPQGPQGTDTGVTYVDSLPDLAILFENGLI